MRTLVLGAGGIGGYFGGRLVEAGADVEFLVRHGRAKRLRAEGLVIESPVGDARLPVKTTTEAMTDAPYDLILLSCKSYDLDSAIDAIRPAVGPHTSVLPLLNGLAHLDRLDAAFGPEHVLGGLAQISVTLLPDGTVRHLNRAATLMYGARSTDQDLNCSAIEALLASARFEKRRSHSIAQEMWEKFAFIATAASITCLMRANVGTILKADDGERLILQMFQECAAVAAAAGFPVRKQAQDWMRAALTQRGSEFAASMLRDLDSGAKIEADHIQGDIIKRGEALDAKVEFLRVAYCHLQSYMSAARAPQPII